MSQNFTLTYPPIHTNVRADEYTCESHVWRYVCACVHAGNIFDAACPDVSKLSLYIDYRAVLDREESCVPSMRKSLISEKKFYIPLLRSISSHATSNIPHPPRCVVQPQQYSLPCAIVAPCTCTCRTERINNVTLGRKCTITIEIAVRT